MKRKMENLDERQPIAIKKFVRSIVDNAQFSRLLNILQDDGKGCVDIGKYVDIKTLRNILYWDLYEYLTKREWGGTIKERMEAMRKRRIEAEKELVLERLK